MKPELEAYIIECANQRDGQSIVEAIKYQYEFECPAFVYAGPGHQSKHECENTWPHDIDGYHENTMYEWRGTSEVDENGKLIKNVGHSGYSCTCNWRD